MSKSFAFACRSRTIVYSVYAEALQVNRYRSFKRYIVLNWIKIYFKFVSFSSSAICAYLLFTLHVLHSLCQTIRKDWLHLISHLFQTLAVSQDVQTEYRSLRLFTQVSTLQQNVSKAKSVGKTFEDTYRYTSVSLTGLLSDISTPVNNTTVDLI